MCLPLPPLSEPVGTENTTTWGKARPYSYRANLDPYMSSAHHGLPPVGSNFCKKSEISPTIGAVPRSSYLRPWRTRPRSSTAPCDAADSMCRLRNAPPWLLHATGNTALAPPLGDFPFHRQGRTPMSVRCTPNFSSRTSRSNAKGSDCESIQGKRRHRYVETAEVLPNRLSMRVQFLLGKPRHRQSSLHRTKWPSPA